MIFGDYATLFVIGFVVVWLVLWALKGFRCRY